jgi:ABC-type taurine transport system substrate-binding protein
MIEYVVVPSAAEAEARQVAKSDPAVTWCRFGDQTLFWRKADEKAELPKEMRQFAARAHHAEGELYLVVQVGNAFLNEFPWVRTAINKGRYLAVDLTAAEIETIRAHAEHACFGFKPMPENTAAIQILARTPPAPSPARQALVAQVSQAELAASLTALTGKHTRHSLRPEFITAANWAEGRLETLGYTVAQSAITVGAGQSVNVIADKLGSGANRKLVIVTAHLDSVNHAGGINGPAPGADDNGSGSAGVLEIARIMSGQPASHDLRLILFGGEEQGLHGSQQYVASLSPAERARVDCVINMDMIGSRNTSELTVMLEGAPVSQGLMDDLAQAANSYTSLTVQTSLNPFASDHVPFINAGMSCLLTIEGADATNHNIHTANDTLDKIHYPLAVEILKMNVAVVAQRLGIVPAQSVRPSSSPVVAWGSDRLDVFVLGTDRQLYHKWWGPGWGPSLTGYEAMGGVCTSIPQVVAWGQNRLDVFLTGTDSALYHKWWDGAAWGPAIDGYEYMGGVCTGDPRVVSWGPNRLDVFVLGTDRALYHKWWDGAAWGPSVTDYEYMGGVCIGQPEVVSWGPNRLDVFVIGTDRALYHKWWDGNAWGPSVDGYERLGGVCMSAPKAVAWGQNRLDVFVTGTDGALYHKWWDGVAWGPSVDGFERLGGICVGEVEAVSWGANRLDVFVIGTDSQLYHKWWDGAAWGPSFDGYEAMGGVCTSRPRVVAWGPNRLDVFVTGTDSQLYHKWFDGAAWGPSLTGYEAMGGVISAFRQPVEAPPPMLSAA